MEGDDAQIHRVRDNGVKLGRKLESLLDETVRQLPNNGPETQGMASRRSDLDLLRHVLGIVEDSDRWLLGLQSFNLLRDAVIDIERLQLELTGSSVLDIEWMRTDANPLTRKRYPQYHARVDGLATLPEDERRLALRDLVVDLREDAQPLQVG